MGMFSEIANAHQAKELEKVLEQGMKSNPSVFDFCKKFVYPIYENCVGESWGSYKEPKHISDAYRTEKS